MSVNGSGIEFVARLTEIAASTEEGSSTACSPARR